jgi:hypothetical protein
MFSSSGTHNNRVLMILSDAGGALCVVGLRHIKQVRRLEGAVCKDECGKVEEMESKFDGTGRE